jgi:hypothetical protein
LIEFEDCIGMKLTLMQQALNLFGRSDGAIGFNTIAVKQKKPVRCFRSGYGNQISIPIADAEKRTSNAGSLLRTSSLWLQSVVHKLLEDERRASPALTMSAGTWGKAGPLICIKAASGGRQRACGTVAPLRIRKVTGPVRPCHARLLTVSTRLRACAWHALRPAALRVPTDNRKEFSFFSSRPLHSKPGGQKNAWACLGLSHPGQRRFSFLEVSLWHTQLTRRREEQQCLLPVSQHGIGWAW